MNVETQRIAPAPIRKTLRVKARQERAFEIFMGGMGRWWPKGHSLLKAPQRDVVVEPRAGGRWYEVGEDGSEYEWGKVLEWQAPDRALLAWQLTGEWAYDPDFVTEVEVRFRADGDHVIVEFEHRKLEAYDPAHAAGMDEGWGTILEGYKREVED